MSALTTHIALDLFTALGAMFALWKGGVAERATAVAILVNILISEIGHLLAPDHIEMINFVNDGVTAAVILFVTVRFGAIWMGAVMLFYAAQFSMHSFYIVTERPHDKLHAWINNIDFQGTVWCLIVGAAVAWRRRVKAAAAAA